MQPATPPRMRPPGLKDIAEQRNPVAELHSPTVSPTISWSRVRGDWSHLGTRKISDVPSLPDFEPLPGAPPAEEGAEDRLGTGETIFNLANTMVGSGVLGVPFAFRLAGYLALPAVLLVVAVTGFTASLLGQALELAAARPEAQDTPRPLRDFAFLAEVAFGAWGRRVVGIATALELWLALVTFLVMSGVNARSFLGVDMHQAIVACTLLAATMVFIPLRVYAYVSLTSLAALLASSLAFLVYLFQLPEWSVPVVRGPLSGPGDFLRAYGMLIFCFAGHPCFPQLNQSMRDGSHWDWCVVLSFSISAMYYVCLGLLGFLALGDELLPCFTANMAGHSIWHTIAAAGFAVKIQLTAPLILRVVLTSLQLGPFAAGGEGSGHKGDVTAASSWKATPLDDSPGAERPLNQGVPTSPQPISPRRRFAACGVQAALGPTLVTAVTAASACLLARDLAALASLCGSALVNLTSVVLPILMYLKMKEKSADPLSQNRATSLCKAAACILIVSLGALAGLAGTCIAAADLIG